MDSRLLPLVDVLVRQLVAEYLANQTNLDAKTDCARKYTKNREESEIDEPAIRHQSG